VTLVSINDSLSKCSTLEDVKIQVKEKTDVVNEGNMSVLDDIFSSSDKSKQKRRRPPQKHRKSKVEHKG
jgi:alpha-acetolactate decarboxylase